MSDKNYYCDRYGKSYHHRDSTENHHKKDKNLYHFYRNKKEKKNKSRSRSRSYNSSYSNESYNSNKNSSYNYHHNHNDKYSCGSEEYYSKYDSKHSSKDTQNHNIPSKSNNKNHNKIHSHSIDSIPNISSSDIKTKVEKFENQFSINFDLIKNIHSKSDRKLPISFTDKEIRNNELFVSNLPMDLEEETIKKIINSALIDSNVEKTEAVLSVQKVVSGNYYLIFFRELKSRGDFLKLDGINILGKKIKIGIPIYLDEDLNNGKINNENNCSLVGKKELFPLLNSFADEIKYQDKIKREGNIGNKEPKEYREYMENNDKINEYVNKLNLIGNGRNNFFNDEKNKNNITTNNYLYEFEDNKKNEYYLEIKYLPLNFTEKDIRKLFGYFGKIIKLRINTKNNEFDGSCAVEYSNKEETENAFNYGNGLKIMGGVINVAKIKYKNYEENDNEKTLVKSLNYSRGSNGLGILANSIHV